MTDLYEQIAIRMGKLATRSDIVVRERRTGGGLDKGIAEQLPDEMTAFYFAK